MDIEALIEQRRAELVVAEERLAAYNIEAAKAWEDLRTGAIACEDAAFVMSERRFLELSADVKSLERAIELLGTLRKP